MTKKKKKDNMYWPKMIGLQILWGFTGLIIILTILMFFLSLIRLINGEISGIAFLIGYFGALYAFYWAAKNIFKWSSKRIEELKQ